MAVPPVPEARNSITPVERPRNNEQRPLRSCQSNAVNRACFKQNRAHLPCTRWEAIGFIGVDLVFRGFRCCRISQLCNSWKWKVSTQATTREPLWSALTRNILSKSVVNVQLPWPWLLPRQYLKYICQDYISWLHKTYAIFICSLLFRHNRWQCHCHYKFTNWLGNILVNLLAMPSLACCHLYSSIYNNDRGCGWTAFNFDTAEVFCNFRNHLLKFLIYNWPATICLTLIL